MKTNLIIALLVVLVTGCATTPEVYLPGQEMRAVMDDATKSKGVEVATLTPTELEAIGQIVSEMNTIEGRGGR